MTPRAALTSHDGVVRCWWADKPQLYRDYHDNEWGFPVHDERGLFERLSLEAFQSGLSWLTILRKREAFRAAFADFDPELVASFTESDRERLIHDSGIVRNRAKIDATINNAGAVLALRDDGGLDRLIWSYADPQPPPIRPGDPIAATTPQSVALAATLKRHKFRFVGPTTAYAAMQACGVVNDHVVGCWRRPR